MNQTLDFEQADEARKLTDCSHNHVLHGLVKLRRESYETGRVRQRADASFPGHPDVGVSFAANQIHCLTFNAIFFFCMKQCIPYTGCFFLTVPPNFQYQNEKQWEANQRLCSMKFLLYN